MWIQLPKDRKKKLLEENIRWGIQLHISTVPALSQHSCAVQFMPWRGLKSTRTGNVMIKHISWNGIQYTCTHIWQRHAFVDTLRGGSGWTSSKEQAGIHANLKSTHKTYRKQVKRSFVGKAQQLQPLKPLGCEMRERKSNTVCLTAWGSK